MSQSFPEYASEHADFIDQLAHATSAMLREAFDHAWTTLSQTGALADFGRLCNELDALEADAEARNEAGRPSKDVYRCAMLCPLTSCFAVRRRSVWPLGTQRRSADRDQSRAPTPSSSCPGTPGPCSRPRSAPSARPAGRSVAHSLRLG